MPKSLLRLPRQVAGNVCQSPSLQKYFYCNKTDVLYAEINMLGHEELRREIARGIKEKFMVKYTEMLSKVGKQKMNNQEVKVFCQ